MSAATVPAVRAALVARFRAALTAAGLLDVSVLYGHPGQEIPPSFVSVSHTVAGLTRDQKRMPLKSTSMEERYGLTVVIWQQDPDYSPETQQALTERAWLIADVLDADLRGNTTLGGVVQWALFTEFDDQDFYLTEGRAAQLVCTVTVNVTRA